jgi:hypothetical protein
LPVVPSRQIVIVNPAQLLALKPERFQRLGRHEPELDVRLG